MHVLINAASANMGGAVTYLQNVLRWLPRLAPEDTFTVYLPAETRQKLGALGEAPNLRLESYPFPDSGGLARLYFDQVHLPLLIRRGGADVLFSTTGFGTLFSPCPQLLLVRNLAYFDPTFHARYRQLGRSLRRNTLRRWFSLASIRQADVVLFPTRSMQEMTAAYISLERKQTAAVHYGFDYEAFARHGDGHSELLERVGRWRAEGYRLLLNVSTYAVQKDFETLVEALPRLAARGVKVKWLTTISRDKTTDLAEYDALKRRAAELGVAEDVVELGYVPYHQLGALYRAADLYVFPSFSESFGHSMVEAMASGLPVVAADTPVNREVCGEAGRYFRTFDPEDCARAMHEVLARPESAGALAAASRERATHFSWEGYAEALLRILKDAVRHGSAASAPSLSRVSSQPSLGTRHD